jgi:hypothetical protein
MAGEEAAPTSPDELESTGHGVALVDATTSRPTVSEHFGLHLPEFRAGRRRPVPTTN